MKMEGRCSSGKERDVARERCVGVSLLGYFDVVAIFGQRNLGLALLIRLIRA